MTFVSPDLAEGVTLTSPTAADGSVNTEGNLNDDNTGTTAANEIRAGMSGYRITHFLDFPVANLDSLSIRVFDGSMMSVQDGVNIYPYQSDDANVTGTNTQNLVVVDDAAYDTLVLSSAFIADLQDIGTNQISIRLACIGSTFRGRFNEIQIEFAEAPAGGGGLNPIMAATERRRQLRRRRR